MPFKPAISRAEKRRYTRDVRASIDKAEREKIAALRAVAREAEARARDTRATVGARCSAARTRVADARALEREARARTRGAREAAKGACALPADYVELVSAVRDARAAWRAADDARRELRAFELRQRRGDRERSRETRATSARVRSSESDDEVRGNIPVQLVPLFNKIRKGIKSTARKSRTEAFLEYVESSPGEAVDAMTDDADRELSRLIADKRAKDAAEHDPDVDFPFGALANPRRLRAPTVGGEMLIQLGLLTRLTYRDVASGRARVLSYGIRSAPILAYNGKGKLFVLYAPSPRGAAPAAAVREYARTHWGIEGEGARVAGTVALDPLVELGPGIAVSYTTRKGGPDGLFGELVSYDHDWGEGGRGDFEPPTVCVHRCRVPKCANNERVAFVGGTYRVTTRGIVG